MIRQLATVTVCAAGAYLVTLGVAAAIRPDLARRFLQSHASSARAHLIELFVRLVVGVAFVFAAEEMWFATAFRAFGWVLIGSTVVLGILPWRLHQRFAQWSVPLATQRMGLLAAGSLLGGAALLLALLVPRGVT